MEGVLLGALRKHANALIKAFHKKVLEHAPVAAVYDLDAGDIELVEEGAPASVMFLASVVGV